MSNGLICLLCKVNDMNATITSLDPYTMAVVLIILSTVCLFTLIALTYIYVCFKQMHSQLQEVVHIIQEDLSAVCNGALGVGQHLAKLEKKTKLMTQQLDKVEMQEAPERSYKQAIKMVRNGANLDQIMMDCDLAQGEAELVLLSENIDKVN